MLEEHFAGKLDRQAFPFVGNPSASAQTASLRSDSIRSTAGSPAPASLRSAKPRWTAGTKAKPSNEPRQRAIVFVAGGMTYSEIRSAYQVSNSLNKDVFVGGFKSPLFLIKVLMSEVYRFYACHYTRKLCSGFEQSRSSAAIYF